MGVVINVTKLQYTASIDVPVQLSFELLMYGIMNILSYGHI